MSTTDPDGDTVTSTIVNLKRPDFAGAPGLGHYLVAIEGAEPGRIIELGADVLTIGRDAGQAAAFADSELSRRHARVSLLMDEVLVEDLNSTNGTYVNDARVEATARLREGSLLRVGRQVFKYERRDRREVERAREAARDLVKAKNYVMSLLPPPIASGPVTVTWQFQPATELGGDAFGYYWLDAETFVIYLLDVSGHGVGAAMHSVMVLNLLRQRALPQVDFTDPAAVLASLNDRLQMDDHDGLFFTIWYGVYRTSTRTLRYGGAGHHAAYLVSPDRQRLDPLGTSNLMIGAVPGIEYDVQETVIEAGSTLQVFSDGVFEIATPDGRQLRLQDFLPFLVQPAEPGVTEPERLHRLVVGTARPGPLDDDCSIVSAVFS